MSSLGKHTACWVLRLPDCFMACIFLAVKRFTVNLWLFLARNVNHDIEEAGRLKLAASHSV